ncbi:hypothetical protein QR680_007119 [Steinernema hermaphroditum]|uniref:Uncharacterized protein n=1 Tax=Steinernema hermaphroditum TaxID=289476 RepID=A0AA39HZ93_9BILA|nr:hypothetical protein QR680_007119 [Steinernema hermaphroditum]
MCGPEFPGWNFFYFNHEYFHHASCTNVLEYYDVAKPQQHQYKRRYAFNGHRPHYSNFSYRGANPQLPLHLAPPPASSRSSQLLPQPDPPSQLLLQPDPAPASSPSSQLPLQPAPPPASSRSSQLPLQSAPPPASSLSNQLPL